MSSLSSSQHRTTTSSSGIGTTSSYQSPTGGTRTSIMSSTKSPTSIHSPSSRLSTTSASIITTSGGGAGSSMPTLPPPPNVTSSPSKTNNITKSNIADSIAKSMTIDEMRQLHQRAQSEAEAKQTELRLVLASRYRELVGSSDEVTKMRERAQELHELVHALPTLLNKLIQSTTTENNNNNQNQTTTTTNVQQQEAKEEDVGTAVVEAGAEGHEQVLQLRRDLSLWPRIVHRALDRNDVHHATTSLLQLFRLIAEQTNIYPLATALSSGVICTNNKSPLDTTLQAQMQMVFLHVQTIPAKIVRISKRIINASASYDGGKDPSFGGQMSAAALSSLDLLDVKQQRDRPVQLLDFYFDSKAKLLQSLLNKLTSTTSSSTTNTTTTTTQEGGGPGGGSAGQRLTADGGAHNAEEILSKIVLILQYDVIMHPYQIFVLRKFPCATCNNPQSLQTTASHIMESLPMFPTELVQSKSSNFLAAHLPLIRTKVKSVLVDIAGTTAAALGQIRQSLYDKTDGVECMERLDNNGICTWEEAVSVMVDVKTVLSSSHGVVGGAIPVAFAEGGNSEDRGGDMGTGSITTSDQPRRFSLWSVLFSNTFSSLVHSLLTTSFHSVHTKLASTLRLSLANAPPLLALLPHEAYRNTLQIASELDTALLKVSDDAHELLVHAEERVESERRLRQSLYVQTCEIMGRLICELRRMLLSSRSNANNNNNNNNNVDSINTNDDDNNNNNNHHHDDSSDAVKQLIVGRLCHLLKFRLTALPTLLHPNSSPAVLHGTSGMISLVELSSAFDLADDNDDGLITFAEAMEAVDSAFSGTQFHGAEMVRETLLLPSSVGGTGGDTTTDKVVPATPGEAVTPHDVTLNELTLLSARGLRHEESGRHSALGTIQSSLDAIIEICFKQWAQAAVSKATTTLSTSIREFVGMTSTTTEMEYKRMYSPTQDSSIGILAAEGSLQNVSSSEPVISNVSPHIVGYILELSSVLSRSICPSDSLVPVPSMEYASAMGILSEREDKIPRMMDMIRWALLCHGLDSVASILDDAMTSTISSTEESMTPVDRNNNKNITSSLTNSGPSGLLQLKNDLLFVNNCFFERNRHGFGTQEEHSTKKVEASKFIIMKLSKTMDTLIAEKAGGISASTTMSSQLQEKHKFIFEACDLFLSSLLGEDTAAGAGAVRDFAAGGGSEFGSSLGYTTTKAGTTTNPLLHTPLTSSCRFPLLPIQSDRTISDVQLRGKYKDTDEGSDSRQDPVGSGGGVMSSGLGFFSSILKKN